MLPKEDNDLLTHTGAGNPMGDLFRRYWIPAVLSEEIPVPDCPPVQVKLLGEELVAFRDSRGRVGLLDEHCSHRGTSLFYGRNEECGLRCIYHGWKYDVDGNVLETPAEPPGSDFRNKIHHKAYPCKEVAGIVFAYMGPREEMPLFPNYEWVSMSPEHLFVSKVFLDCNWLQGLEGDCDSSHLSYLHRSLGGDRQTFENQGYAADGAPNLEAVDTDYGVRMISLRKTGPDSNLFRVTNFVMPCQGFIPGGLQGMTVHYWVPIDDTHLWKYYIVCNRDRPLREEERTLGKDLDQEFKKLRNLQNNYGMDREAQKTKTFIGVGPSFFIHDACATETMGPIYDRSREHLAASDETVIAIRKFLLKAVKSFQAGEEPPHIVRGAASNSFRHLVTISEQLPASVSPEERLAQKIAE
ncbi:MAG: Rieske 2Fe-2S domain-containing protein [Deltaproteobacteria bacterium]|nr:Rieske 2Fe-2S domain-containing protein [Deltaproteobacteria bacterium]